MYSWNLSEKYVVCNVFSEVLDKNLQDAKAISEEYQKLDKLIKEGRGIN